MQSRTSRTILHSAKVHAHKAIMECQAARLICIFITLVISPLQVLGHGYIYIPGARNTAWRHGFNNPIQYTDTQLNCGGFWVQWGENNGQCGVCGDPWNEENTGEYVYPGKYAVRQIITATYTRGQVIDVTIRITANHKGFFIFRIGDIGTAPITQEKLIYDLAHPDGSTVWDIPESYAWQFTEVYHLKLPDDLVCEHCVLQWWWTCGNNWGVAQETFVNCADVRIVDSDPNASTSPPNTTPSTTQPITTTAQPETTVTTKQTTVQTTTEKPSTQATTTTSKPTTEENTTPKPTTKASTTPEQTTTAKPTTVATTQKTTKATTTQKPTTEASTIEKMTTVATQPSTQKTSTKATTTDSPTTTNDPATVTCRATEKRRRRFPNADKFCRVNCPLGYCPSRWCICDGDPVQDDGCYSFGKHEGQYYDYLCRVTCMRRPDCPTDRCSDACALLYDP